MRLSTERRRTVTLILIALFAISARIFAQSGVNQTSDPKLAVEVEQAIRNFYKAFERGDHEGVSSFIVDEGFNYDAGFDIYSGTIAKSRLNSSIDQRRNREYTFEVSNFTVVFAGNDSAAANYRMESKSIADPNDLELDQITDTLVRRNGRWQILAEHTSPIPKPAEPIIAGLPAGWRRATVATANNYLITVDTATKHSGSASASIKFGCGSDQDSWVALTQSIAADDYRGKRIRLSGWLKTEDAGGSSLWMRVDGERQTLTFDNMQNRLIKGTSDWKLYSVVLDVPAEAKNIFFGVLPRGRGQTWADDLKLDVVDNSVASTNIETPESAKEDQPSITKLPKATNRHAVNLGFEDGVVH